MAAMPWYRFLAGAGISIFFSHATGAGKPGSFLWTRHSNEAQKYAFGRAKMCILQAD
jgi:hypothetical protein